MPQSYDAAAIEVLSGLDPVRKRPGMFTDTSRPNHLAHEVVDNSVDEAIAGYAKRIDVTLHEDNSLEVRDDGRGMPVDLHPEEQVPGVEVVLTRLHAGGKFSNKSYRFSGGLHGVGVSVVNALSANLEVEVRRDGQEYRMSFANGEKTSELEVVGPAAAAPAPLCVSGPTRRISRPSTSPSLTCCISCAPRRSCARAFRYDSATPRPASRWNGIIGMACGPTCWTP